MYRFCFSLEYLSFQYRDNMLQLSYGKGENRFNLLQRYSFNLVLRIMKFYKPKQAIFDTRFHVWVLKVDLGLQIPHTL